MRKVNRILALMFWCVFWAAPVPVDASHSITLAWNSNPEDNLGGYRVYIGFASRQYHTSIFVGNVPSCTLTDLPDVPLYFLALTAVSEDGTMESDFSDEIIVARDPYLRLSIDSNSGNSIIELLGAPSKRYLVETSPDFLNWTPFISGFSDRTGSCVWVVNFLFSPGNNRFYRAVEN